MYVTKLLTVACSSLRAVCNSLRASRNSIMAACNLQLPQGSLHLPHGGLQLHHGSPQLRHGGPQLPQGGLQLHHGSLKLPQDCRQLHHGGLKFLQGSPHLHHGGLKFPQGSPHLHHGGPKFPQGCLQLSQSGTQLRRKWFCIRGSGHGPGSSGKRARPGTARAQGVLGQCSQVWVVLYGARSYTLRPLWNSSTSISYDSMTAGDNYRDHSVSFWKAKIPSSMHVPPWQIFVSSTWHLAFNPCLRNIMIKKN